MAGKASKPVNKPVPVIELEPIQEEATIDETVLLENISNLRFVDKNGKFFRLEAKASGVYWLYPA